MIYILKDENEIKKRIKYIDDQINLQNGEKLNLENEREIKLIQEKYHNG